MRLLLILLGAWVDYATFLRPSVPDSGPTYGEVFGYPPSPVAYPDIILRPGAERPGDRIRAVMHYA